MRSFKRYIHCGTAAGVKDAFDPHALWQSVPGKKNTGDYLFDALQSHPLGKRTWRSRERFFPHVIVRLPLNMLQDDDNIENGRRRRELIQELRALHDRHFGIRLPEGQEVRYQVTGDAGLNENEVKFCFGSAVYVPALGERPTGALFAETGPDRKQIGFVYPGQRLILLGREQDLNTFGIENWPFESDSHVLLPLKKGSISDSEPQFFNHRQDLTCTPEEIGWRIGKEENECSLKLEIEPATGAHPVDDDLEGMENIEQPFLHRGVIIDPWGGDANEPEPNQPPVSEAAGEESPDYSGTWVSGAETHRALQIIGIALHRMSRFSQHGVRAWRFAIDKQGQCVANPLWDKMTSIEVDIDDRIYVAAGGGKERIQVRLERPFLVGDLELTVHGFEGLMADYLGWMDLRPPFVKSNLPSAGECTLGRDISNAMILDFFRNESGFIWEPGAKKEGMSPEILNFSKKQLAFRISSEVAEVENIGNGAVYLMPAGRRSAARLDPNPLQHGDRIITGGYILEYLENE